MSSAAARFCPRNDRDSGYVWDRRFPAVFGSEEQGARHAVLRCRLHVAARVHDYADAGRQHGVQVHCRHVVALPQHQVRPGRLLEGSHGRSSNPGQQHSGSGDVWRSVQDDAGADDAQNREILMRLQESGVAVPSGTVLGGRFAIRVAISNHRSRREDFDLLVRSVEEIGRTIVAS